MLSCKELIRLAASDELAQKSFAVRLMATAHFAMCRNCAPYIRGLARIAELARRSEFAEYRMSAAGEMGVMQAVRAALGSPREN